MNHLQHLVLKAYELSTKEEQGYSWGRLQATKYRSYLIRYLKRNSEARNTLIDIKRSVNNRTYILEQFANNFMAELNIKIK
jgi:hypothetical protein